MRTLILVNTLDRVSSFVYQNHIAFAAYNARKFPHDNFFWFSPHRQPIDTARNEAARQALRLECDYLMFIDDDVLIPANTFEILHHADNGDISAGLVYLRGYPFDIMAFKQIETDVMDENGRPVKDPRLKLTYFNEVHERAKNGDKIVECAAVGFSCCLISCDILSAMEPPYFCTGPLNTEDVYFCLKTRNLEPKPKITVNTEVRCGHLLNPEPIEFDTRLLLTDFYNNLARKFEDAVNPTGEEIDKNPRNLNYIERNLSAL